MNPADLAAQGDKDSSSEDSSDSSSDDSARPVVKRKSLSFLFKKLGRYTDYDLSSPIDVEKTPSYTPGSPHLRPDIRLACPPSYRGGR
jgi:hypothetical protein